MNFMDRLSDYMEKNNLRQIDIVRLCKSDKTLLSAIMCGKRQPNITLLSGLSKLSGKTINWWLYGEEDNLYEPLDTVITTYLDINLIDKNGIMNETTRSSLNYILDYIIKNKINLKEK